MDDNQWLNDFLEDSIPKWKADPVMFMREVLLFEPDDWQIEVAHDLRDYPRVSVKSGQGVGKTGLEAALLLWFLVCYPYPRIVATAPTKQQLHDVLWSEVDKWMNNSPLLPMLLKWTKTYSKNRVIRVYDSFADDLKLTFPPNKFDNDPDGWLVMEGLGRALLQSYAKQGAITNVDAENDFYVDQSKSIGDETFFNVGLQAVDSAEKLYFSVSTR